MLTVEKRGVIIDRFSPEPREDTFAEIAHDEDGMISHIRALEACFLSWRMLPWWTHFTAGWMRCSAGDGKRKGTDECDRRCWQMLNATCTMGHDSIRITLVVEWSEKLVHGTSTESLSFLWYLQMLRVLRWSRSARLGNMSCICTQ